MAGSRELSEQRTGKIQCESVSSIPCHFGSKCTRHQGKATLASPQITPTARSGKVFSNIFKMKMGN